MTNLFILWRIEQVGLLETITHGYKQINNNNEKKKEKKPGSRQDWSWVMSESEWELKNSPAHTSTKKYSDLDAGLNIHLLLKHKTHK